MRTQSTRQVEALTFEKLGTASLIIGPNKVLLKRHIVKPLKAFYVKYDSEIICFVLALVIGLILGSRI